MNRRVRTRTPGGVGGRGLAAPSYPIASALAGGYAVLAALQILNYHYEGAFSILTGER